jgi:hypothetical protein
MAGTRARGTENAMMNVTHMTRCLLTLSLSAWSLQETEQPR